LKSAAYDCYWPTPACHYHITQQTADERKAAIRQELFLTARWTGIGQKQNFEKFSKRLNLKLSV
jgi:hypothetical protein